jgi:hypothetical protein
VRAEEVNLFYPLRNHSLAKQQLLLLCLFALFVVVHPKVYCNSSSIDTMANNNGRQGGGGGGNNQMNEHVEFTVKVSEEKVIKRKVAFVGLHLVLVSLKTTLSIQYRQKSSL